MANKRSTAYFFLEGLVDLGIEYVFANLGTDHVSLIEAMAEWRAEGRRHPEVVLCPHENVAIHMAGGYAAATGRGQAVLVHVDAGTANAAMGMQNLCRARLPVLLLAGKAPFSLRGELPGSRDNYVHFVQDPFDIASLVRPYVKWEYNLPRGVVVKEVLRRAHSVMQSDPPGPVYLTLPREVLAEDWDPTSVRPFGAEHHGPVAAGGIDEARLEMLADELIAARSPMAVTAYLGRKAEAVAALRDLAELCGIQVFEFQPSYLAMARDSVCFGGFDPVPALADADVGLLLDVDVPWLPRFAAENPRTRWLHIDVDPMKKDFPMWGFASHVRIQADCATVLGQLSARIRAKADAGFRERAARRLQQRAAQAADRASRLALAAEPRGGPGALSPAHVCAAVGRAIRDTDIVVNEAVRNSPAVLQHIPRSRPLTLLGGAGAGLGFSGGMALGFKLARPGARVIQIVGDGSFHFSTPTSVYAVAQACRAPILTLVLDNGGWLAVKEAVLRVYPDGKARQADEYQARLAGPERRFEQVAQAFGGYGERVDDPETLDAALARCLAAVDRGQAALLNVQVGQQ